MGGFGSDAASIQAQITECEINIAKNKEKIEKLKKCKEVVKDVKGEVQSEKKAALNTVRQADEWEGENYDIYEAEAEGNLATGYGKYISETDAILDSINDEITRLENENYSTEGLLGILKSALNSIFNKIENFFN